MGNILSKITQADAEYLAQQGLPAFVNQSEDPDMYGTYTDVAADHFAGPFSEIEVSDELNDLFWELTYNAVDGTYPVRKNKKPFPRL